MRVESGDIRLQNNQGSVGLVLFDLTWHLEGLKEPKKTQMFAERQSVICGIELEY